MLLRFEPGAPHGPSDNSSLILPQARMGGCCFGACRRGTEGNSCTRDPKLEKQECFVPRGKCPCGHLPVSLTDRLLAPASPKDRAPSWCLGSWPFQEACWGKWVSSWAPDPLPSPVWSHWGKDSLQWWLSPWPWVAGLHWHWLGGVPAAGWARFRLSGSLLSPFTLDFWFWKFANLWTSLEE